eukprot:5140516-Alexandrium_andersonii.AAC.1
MRRKRDRHRPTYPPGGCAAVQAALLGPGPVFPVPRAGRAGGLPQSPRACPASETGSPDLGEGGCPWSASDLGG